MPAAPRRKRSVNVTALDNEVILSLLYSHFCTHFCALQQLTALREQFNRVDVTQTGTLSPEEVELLIKEVISRGR